MKRLTRDVTIEDFDKDATPAVEIEPGEKLVVETNLSAQPATGPIAVRGAGPGDTLVVTIHDIRVENAHWWYWFGDKAYCRQGVYKEIEPLIKDYPVRTHRIGRGVDLSLPIEDGQVVFSPKLRAPLKPMIGVIGVAPAGEPRATNMSGHYGGNLDCHDIAAGAKVYLSLNAPGGLLAISDLHGTQPDGDIFPCIESSGEVVLSAEIRKGMVLPLVLVETADFIETIGCGERVDGAVNDAVEGMLHVLQKHANLSFFEAAQLVGACADMRVCQLIDPTITIRAVLSKQVLPNLVL